MARGGFAAAALLAPWTQTARARAATPVAADFTGSGEGWPGWRCVGTANLRREAGAGVLEAGSDVFPCDPRPVAFAVDQRFADGEIAATLTAAGAGAGLVLRRTGPRDYYAAILDDERSLLVLVRRSPAGLVELARAPARPLTGPIEMTFGAVGGNPTKLHATVSAAGLGAEARATDAAAELQGAGDPGVLATARTLFPSAGPEVLPALGNLHLLPYGVQEGQSVMASPIGQALLGTIHERSTAKFSRVELRPAGPPQPTPAAVVAATTGRPIAGGARLRIATDLPARVEIEVAADPSFAGSRRVRAGRTGAFDALLPALRGCGPDGRIHWRARVRRGGLETVGPARSFRPLPGAGSSARATLAIGACAAQFGPIFDHIGAAAPDAFVWQGDLNYPDTVGPLAQSLSGYAGIWREFLTNPRMAPIFERSMFAVQRDDHDFGIQDANSTNIPPWGRAPWEALMESHPWYRFSAGLADVWVLDQRSRKSDPELPDTPAKTLLGPEQRAWLMATLARSRAPFKVVCSPCTLAPLPANGRDGSWAEGFTAERDLVLGHVRHAVSGRTIFVTGDTHWTMAYEHDGLFEARPCPLGIPTPNDITITDPQVAEDARKQPGVLYADDNRGHVALLDVRGEDGHAVLDLTLMRDDGATPFTHRFEQPLETYGPPA